MLLSLSLYLSLSFLVHSTFFLYFFFIFLLFCFVAYVLFPLCLSLSLPSFFYFFIYDLSYLFHFASSPYNLFPICDSLLFSLYVCVSACVCIDSIRYYISLPISFALSLSLSPALFYRFDVMNNNG